MFIRSVSILVFFSLVKNGNKYVKIQTSKIAKKKLLFLIFLSKFCTYPFFIANDAFET